MIRGDTSREEYRQALIQAMSVVAEEAPNAVFMGQAVARPGTAMSSTFCAVNRDQLLEMPVAEDMQMGMAIGMSLAGYLPVCIYPRWNFLLLAANQLVLHLDKLTLYSDYRPKVIVRVAVATDKPMDPGPQHLGDYSFAIEQMFHTIRVERLTRAEQVLPAYRDALRRRQSTVLVEFSELYA